MIHGSLAPASICVPAAVIMALLLVVHLRATAKSDHPASRKRIRLANGAIMLVNTPLLAAGFSLIDPNKHTAMWVLTWIAAIVLLLFSIGLAVLDVMNTMRLNRIAARDLTQVFGAQMQTRR